MEPTPLEMQFTQEYSAHFPPPDTPTLEVSQEWVTAWWAAHPFTQDQAPTMGPPEMAAAE